MTLGEQALKYLEAGWPVVPEKDKKPLVRVKDYESKLPKPEEVSWWWKQWPDANIGLLTGKLSGVMVLDLDSDAGASAVEPYIPDAAEIPTVKTPHGRHLYFQYNVHARNGHILEDVEFKVGTKVTLPPSIGEDGVEYRWLVPPSGKFPAIPAELLNLQKNKAQTAIRVETIEPFKVGHRNEDLFNAATHMFKGGMPDEKVRAALFMINNGVPSPLPASEVQAIFISAKERSVSRTACLVDDIRAWVANTDGSFSASDIRRALYITSKPEEANLYVILSRMRRDNVIERVGTKAHVYRRVEKDCSEMDWRHAPEVEVPLILPLGLSDIASLYEKSLVLVAGQSNQGKSALLLNIIKDNMEKFPIHYFSSEFGPSMMKRRLMMFEDVPLDTWKFKCYSRQSEFCDAVHPNDINIIDWLWSGTEFYTVGADLKKIFDKLERGMAIVALQKDPGKDYGRGGAITMDLASLYVSIFPGQAKIIKCKNWKNPESNPNGKVIDFKLVHGSMFKPSPLGWQDPDALEAAEGARSGKSKYKVRF